LLKKTVISPSTIRVINFSETPLGLKAAAQAIPVSRITIGGSTGNRVTA